MIPLQKLIEQEQRTLIDSSGMPIKYEQGSAISQQKTESLITLLKSADNMHTIPECIQELKALKRGTRNSARRTRKTIREIPGQNQGLKIKRRYQKRVNELIRILINTLKNKALDLEQIPAYQKLRDIVFLLEDTLKLKERYKPESGDNGLRTDEKIIAVAYFYARYGERGTTIISNDGHFRSLLEGTIDVLSSKEFEPESKLFIPMIKTNSRRIKLYSIDHRTNICRLKFNSALYRPTLTTKGLTPEHIEKIKQNLDYRLAHIPG